VYFERPMFSLTALSWLLVVLAAVLIGFSKTGILGVSLLVVVLMASVFPAKQSVGIVLPLLSFADVFAVIFYRRHANWKNLLRLLPFTALGVVAGFFFLGRISSEQLGPIIGVVVLAMLGLSVFLQLRKSEGTPRGLLFPAFIGIMAGFTTMIANAAAPLMTIYLISMKAEKKEFVGTAAWFFAVVNLFKVPFSIGLGLITVQSFTFDLMLLPAIVAGAVGGYFLLRVIPQKIFNVVLLVLAGASAVNLILS
jgi:uncharacterized membrane protein YfcA